MEGINQKKTIAHLIIDLGDGGAQNLIYTYFSNLDKDKFNLILISVSPSSKSCIEQKFKDMGIKIYYLNNKISNHKIVKLYIRIAKIIELRKICKKENISIIHSHLNVLFYTLFISKNIYNFHTFHNTIDSLFSNREYKLISKFIDYFKFQNYTFFTLHEIMLDEYKKILKRSTIIQLNNCIDVDLIQSVSKENFVINNFPQLNEDDVILGHVGRLNKVKNQEFLVNLINVLPINYKLILVGFGPDYNKLNMLIKQYNLNSRVFMLGNRKDTYMILSKIDYFLFPSLYEGLPLALLEAQAANKICLISDNINKNVIATDKVKILSLDELSEWSEFILKKKCNFESPTRKLRDYDVKVVVELLSYYYLKH